MKRNVSGVIGRLILCISLFSLNLWAATVTEWDGKPAYTTPLSVPETRAYKIYSKQAKTERAKMHYLMNLVRFSEYEFWRNGRTFPGNIAIQGFYHKMKKHGREATTAREWISKIGTHSNKTRERYRILYPDGSSAYSSEVFSNELDRLEAYEQFLEQKQVAGEMTISLEENKDQFNEIIKES